MPSRESTSILHPFHQAAAGTFDSSRQPITQIVIHSMDGSFLGTRAWFQKENREKPTSAHYGISYEGEIDRYVPEDKTAYHAGNYLVNQTSIGIEFEDKGDNQAPRPDSLYQTGSVLINDICRFYNLPIDRNTIKLHNEVKLGGTSCPGNLDVDRLIEGAKNLSLPTQPQPTPQTTPSTDQVSLDRVLFEKLVTEGRNWNEIANIFKLDTQDTILPGVLRLQPDAALKVSDYINRLNFERNYWESEYKKLQASSSTPQAVVTTPPPQVVVTPPPQVSTPTPPSTTPQPLLESIFNDKTTIDQGKVALQSDVFGLIKWLKSIFWI